MSALSRRAALLAMTALLPALASRGTFAQSSEISIVPPLVPMIYTRRLVRSLTGDAQIVVERKFSVRFIPSDTGFVVEGEQIAVEVEMPEQLASLGRLERDRIERGIFPLELDRSGRILSGKEAADAPEIEAALLDVAARVKRLESPADEQEALRRFIAAIHEAGTHIVSSLPPDLFAPVETNRTASRDIALPNGREGAVSTLFSARRDPETGLMRSARREVVTAIAGDSRRTVETFSLAPQAATAPAR